MSQRRHTHPTRLFRSRIAVALIVGVLGCVIAVGAFAQSGGKSTLIGKLEGPEVVTDPAKVPKTFKEAPQLAELVKARQAAAGRRARRAGSARHQAAEGDRQVRRHVARRLHGPGGLLERLPLLLGAGPSDVLGLHGRQGPAEPRQGPRDAGRRARVAPAPAPRHEVERRQAVHRRRLRVLVRGHLPEQGPRADAVGGPGHQRQAGRDREGRHLHGALQVPRAVLHAARRAGRLDRPRRPVGGYRAHGRLRARALPEAVPSEVRQGRGARQEGQGREVRFAGCACSSPRTTGRSTRISRCSRRGRR